MRHGSRELARRLNAAVCKTYLFKLQIIKLLGRTNDDDSFLLIRRSGSAQLQVCPPRRRPQQQQQQPTVLPKNEAVRSKSTQL